MPPATCTTTYLSCVFGVQSFISSFEYNQCTGYNYNVLKQRPLQGILATAAGILAQPLPIKCIGKHSQPSLHSGGPVTTPAGRAYNVIITPTAMLWS